MHRAIATSSLFLLLLLLFRTKIKQRNARVAVETHRGLRPPFFFSPKVICNKFRTRSAAAASAPRDGDFIDLSAARGDIIRYAHDNVYLCVFYIIYSESADNRRAWIVTRTGTTIIIARHRFYPECGRTSARAAFGHRCPLFAGKKSPEYIMCIIRFIIQYAPAARGRACVLTRFVVFSTFMILY